LQQVLLASCAGRNAKSLANTEMKSPAEMRGFLHVKLIQNFIEQTLRFTSASLSAAERAIDEPNARHGKFTVQAL